MAETSRLYRLILRSSSVSAVIRTPVTGYLHRQTKTLTTTETIASSPREGDNYEKKKGNWLTLPPFKATVDGGSLGKNIASGGGASTSQTTTAIKWVMRCCPQLPRSLVQKLFRLRQVRRETSRLASSDQDDQALERRIRRVSAKDCMNHGDTIFLPNSVEEQPSENAACACSEEDLKFLLDLELYKDQAIIVINKPPGMPVQGGIGIKTSLDQLAGTYLRYDYSEPPRLVHRLDRDSSGILVLGRTQLSATVLHSIFREKTFGASVDLKSEKRFLQRKYVALVLGSPKHPEGLISAPLGKVILDDGRSERITVVDDVQTMPSQHSITEYRVLNSSSHGLTWLELSPLTGRKHQLRVHCAEVLGTPIVGDYKYGWQAHRKFKLLPLSKFEENLKQNIHKGNALPFGLDLENGSISAKQPNLHLHCRKMVLPDVASTLHHAHISSEYDFADVKALKFVAPLPSHMQRSWDILSS